MVHAAVPARAALCAAFSFRRGDEQRRLFSCEGCVCCTPVARIGRYLQWDVPVHVLTLVQHRFELLSVETSWATITCDSQSTIAWPGERRILELFSKAFVIRHEVLDTLLNRLPLLEKHFR